LTYVILQRAILLEAWKKFEQDHGTEDDVAKVQGMMPIFGRKEHVDQETGQVVQGKHPQPYPISDHFLVFAPVQTGNLFSLMMNARQTQHLSSFCRWPTLGKIQRHEGPVTRVYFLDSPQRRLRKRIQFQRIYVQLMTQQAMCLAQIADNE
jgi:hypothetical protein